ncbi:hypothetical protein LPIBR_40008 [Lacticaseibacillus paracasei]|nr:hypothetical protein LPIBR_40008 [Lacticaseibacillus paracasei]
MQAGEWGLQQKTMRGDSYVSINHRHSVGNHRHDSSYYKHKLSVQMASI